MSFEEAYLIFITVDAQNLIVPIYFLENGTTKAEDAAPLLEQSSASRRLCGDERMNLEYNYSPELDILSVDDSSREYGRSVRTGDFVIDLSPEGEVRGVEIQNVSRILGIDREELNEVSNVEISSSSGKELGVTLRLEIDEQVNTLAAQITGEEVSA